MSNYSTQSDEVSRSVEARLYLADMLFKKMQVFCCADVDKVPAELGTCVKNVASSLVETTFLEPIIQAVTHSKLRIVFDFETNVCKRPLIEPTNKVYGNYTMFLQRKTIYVAAKSLLAGENSLKILGGIACLLCQFVIEKLYRNGFKPYTECNFECKVFLDSVVQECRSIQEKNAFIELFFFNTTKEMWHTELVSFVAYLVVVYKHDVALVNDFAQVYDRLFCFFNDQVLLQTVLILPQLVTADRIENFIEKNCRVNEQDCVWGEKCTDLLQFKVQIFPDETTSAHFLVSNWPNITLNMLYYTKTPLHLFINHKLLLNEAALIEVVEMLESHPLMWLIVDCSNFSYKESDLYDKILQKSKNRRIIFVCKHTPDENCSVSHCWEHLTEATKITNRAKMVTLQGVDVPLQILISDLDPSTFNEFPLETLLFSKIIIGNPLDDGDCNMKLMAVKRNSTRKIKITAQMKNAKDFGMKCGLLKKGAPGCWVVPVSRIQFLNAHTSLNAESEVQFDVEKIVCTELHGSSPFDKAMFRHLLVQNKVFFTIDSFEMKFGDFERFNRHLVTAINNLQGGIVFFSSTN